MNKAEIIEKLRKGEIKIYEIESHTENAQIAMDIRREYIETILDLDLSEVADTAFDPGQVHSRNCENVIGQASLPVGIVGPLKIQTDTLEASFFIPLATTEGALVASVNRGISIITKSGGSITTSKYNGITRAPLFRTSGIKSSKNLIRYVKENFQDLKGLAESTNTYLKLKDYETETNGRSVWIRFHFDTDQAMGMNMAVVATKAICDYLEKQVDDIKTIAISGNLCIDKKPATINTISGRGYHVEAEVIIPKELVEKYLKCSVEQIVETNTRKIWQGSALAGSLGFNAHIANMIAAAYIALGQDPAHVVDASVSYTTMEEKSGDLYAVVKIPSMNLATVGGGTGLTTQSKYLELVLKNIDGDMPKDINKAKLLSQILGATVLAGEISLAAAFASDSFVKAHEDLGRSTN